MRGVKIFEICWGKRSNLGRLKTESASTGSALERDSKNERILGKLVSLGNCVHWRLGLRIRGTDFSPFHGDILPAAAKKQIRQDCGISMPIKEHSVSSVKDAMINIIGRQPEDSTYDEILRELAYARMVQRGLEDADAGRTVPDGDVG